MTTFGGKNKHGFFSKTNKQMISLLFPMNHEDIDLSKNVGFPRDIFFESEIGIRHGVIEHYTSLE